MLNACKTPKIHIPPIGEPITENTQKTTLSTKRESFKDFKERVIKNFAGKPLAKKMPGFASSTIISLTKNGYLFKMMLVVLLLKMKAAAKEKLKVFLLQNRSLHLSL